MIEIHRKIKIKTLFYHHLLDSIIRFFHESFHNRSKTGALFEPIYGVFYSDIMSRSPLRTPKQETYFMEMAIVLESIEV